MLKMTAPELQRLTAQLRFSRLRNDKTVAGVARRLGVDAETFSRWEAGLVDMPASQLLVWSELVGAPAHLSPSNSKSMLVDHNGSLWLPGEDAASTLVTGARSWEVAESIVHTFTGVEKNWMSISEYVRPVRIGQNHAKSIGDNSWNYSKASETGVQYAIDRLDLDRQYYLRAGESLSLTLTDSLSLTGRAFRNLFKVLWLKTGMFSLCRRELDQIDGLKALTRTS